MSFVVLENFRQGLDTRRSILTSAIGSLAVATNCHINQGGEIEKRKAFVKTDLTPTLASGVTTILGIEALASSMVLFGSQDNADIAHWPPAGFTYQVLKRKSISTTLSGVTYPSSPNYCAQCANIIAEVMASQVVHTTVFAGKAWVIALMSDSTYCVFYDGKAIDDIDHMMRMMPDMNSNLKLFCMMARAFLGDAAVEQDAVQGYVADVHSTLDGINITGQPGRDFSVLVESSFSPTPTVTFVNNYTPTVPGKVATGYFTIQDGVQGGGAAITSVKVGATELLLDTAVPGTPDPVLYTRTPATTAALIVTSINAAVTAFNARNIGGTVIIYADANGTTDNEKDITVVTTGKVMIGNCHLNFAGSAFQLDYIKASGINLLSAAMTFPTAGETMEAFVGRVATDINTGTGTHGYVAMNRDALIKFSKVTTVSSPDNANVPIDVALTPTAATDTGGVSEGAQLSVQVDKNTIDIYFDVIPIPRSGNFRFKGIGGTQYPVKGLVLGGIGPYKFQWKLQDQINADISIEFPNADMTHFRDLKVPVDGVSYAANPKFANIYLEVTDFEGTKVQSATIPAKFYTRVVAS